MPPCAANGDQETCGHCRRVREREARARRWTERLIAMLSSEEDSNA